MATVRTFVAIPLPGLVRQALSEVTAHLAHLDGQVRWVASDNVHLTLKFLGDAEASRLPDVTDAVAGVTAEVAPFTLKTTTVGGGSHAGRARVIWVRVGGDLEALSRLQAGIETAAEALGFPREKRKFLPHLTLGRARRGPVSLPDETPCRPVSFRVDRVTVYRSDLRPEGAVYTPLGYGPLKAL